jgi:hypothetical protein
LSWVLPEQDRKLMLALSPRERYGFFLQITVDTEEAWGLKNADGWVLAGDEGRDAFPLWPHEDLAAACALGDWAAAVPEAIGLDELLEDLLPILEEDGIAVAVFPGPDGDSAVVPPADFRHDLEAEIELGAPAGETDDEDHDHVHDHEEPS